MSRMILVALLVAIGHCISMAQVPNKKSRDLLCNYYKYCKRHLTDSRVLQKCDSLYVQAAVNQDHLMQILALDLRAGHYAQTNDEADLVDAVQRIKDSCIKYGKKEYIRLYYLSWTNRLISYYISHNQTNAAVYEACKLIAEAEEDGYLPAKRYCYRLLGDIYFDQFNYELAYQNYTEALHVNAPDSVQDLLPEILHMKRAESALELGLRDTVWQILHNIDLTKVRPQYPLYTVRRMRLLYDLHMNNYAQARTELQALEDLFAKRRGLKPYLANLYALRSSYYESTGDYVRARNEALRVLNTPVPPKDRTLLQRTAVQLGNIYWQLGDYHQASDFYRRYIDYVDWLRAEMSRMASNDLSGILDRVRLQNKTRELQLDIKDRRLETTYLIIGALAIIIFVSGIGLFHFFRLNRRLRLSESTVMAQNEHLKHKSEELRNAKERAEMASLTKTHFIQNMSHEVRTPLNAIVGFSQILAAQSGKESELCEYGHIIESSSKDLLRLIDDVLDVASLDQKERLDLTDCCELNTLCAACVKDTRPLVRAGVEIHFEAHPGNPVILSNVRRVEQILKHLLQNAAKFTREGFISLKYSPNAETGVLQFEVTDSGIGIPPEQSEKIFERFIKLNSFSQGAGLGLSIARDVARKLGGRLYVDTAYTQGCRMILELPYTAGDAMGA